MIIDMRKGERLIITCFMLLSTTFRCTHSFHLERFRPSRIAMPHPLVRDSVARPMSSLGSPAEDHGKVLPKANLTSFLMTIVAFPLWATTVLPLSVVFQAGAAVLRPLSKSELKTPTIDSGYVVDEDLIIPRAERKYDIIVLGATGFTGKLAARHLAKAYGVNKTVKWAIAGRSESKLEKVKQDLARELGITDLSSLDTVVVDTAVASTMPSLVNQTRVVATTAGPYTLYGNSVVEFCCKFGTHYVDITGETDWVKAMLCYWHDTAAQTGAKIISFCGHDSIPWDLSVMKLQEVIEKELNDEMTSVVFWDEMRGAAPGGTFATVINAISGNSLKPPRVDYDPFLRLQNGSKSQHVCKAVLPSVLQKASSPWEDSATTQRWTMPFVMAAVNSQVVRWSYASRSRGSNSLSYTEVAVCPDFKTAFTSYAGLVMGGSMLFNPLTASFLKKMVTQPGDGPNMKAMETKHFLCVKGEAIGVNGNRAESVFYLDKDAGCLETSRMLVESGLCLALTEDELPSTTGGFFSPATGLGGVLLNRLTETGTTFKTTGISVNSVRSKL